MSEPPPLDDVVAQQARRVTPTAAERSRLDGAVAALLARARRVRDAAAEHGLEPFEPLLVGSAAKDTWLPGHVDLDVFLLYPPGLPRERLEATGLAAGRLILPEWRLRYAEHPYVMGPFEGFTADVVPAYRVAHAGAIQSAVDRTPFHNEWVQGRIRAAPGLTTEVRLFKAWLRGIEVYGAETARRGVSGYLAEVLVLAHGGFRATLEWLARAGHGARLDPSGHSQARFPDEPLVVIDPVDPARNAAAALRADRWDRLRAGARAFLAAPHERFFQPAPLVPPDPEPARRLLGEGGLVLVTFPLPEMREDAVVPHLDRAAGALAASLERGGFTVRASQGGTTPDEALACLAVWTREARLPAVRLHVGPPIGLAQRAEAFRRKHAANPDAVDAPFELEWDGTRRVAVRLREHERDLASRVTTLVGTNALGKHVDRAVGKGGLAVRSWQDALGDARLAPIVARILCPVAPWERTGDGARDYPVAHAVDA